MGSIKEKSNIDMKKDYGEGYNRGYNLINEI